MGSFSYIYASVRRDGTGRNLLGRACIAHIYASLKILLNAGRSITNACLPVLCAPCPHGVLTYSGSTEPVLHSESNETLLSLVQGHHYQVYRERLPYVSTPLFAEYALNVCVTVNKGDLVVPHLQMQNRNALQCKYDSDASKIHGIKQMINQCVAAR